MVFAHAIKGGQRMFACAVALEQQLQQAELQLRTGCLVFALAAGPAICAQDS